MEQSKEEIFIYHAQENVIREKAKPEPELHKDALNAYIEEMKEYRSYIASLKQYNCHPSCREVWKDGEEVVLMKDFYTKSELKFTRKAKNVPEFKETAYAILQEEPQDELWYKVIQIIMDNYHAANYPEQAVKQLSNQFTITRNK